MTIHCISEYYYKWIVMSFDLHPSTELSSKKPPFLEHGDKPLERQHARNASNEAPEQQYLKTSRHET